MCFEWIFVWITYFEGITLLEYYNVISLRKFLVPFVTLLLVMQGYTLELSLGLTRDLMSLVNHWVGCHSVFVGNKRGNRGYNHIQRMRNLATKLLAFTPSD